MAAGERGAWSRRAALVAVVLAEGLLTTAGVRAQAPPDTIPADTAVVTHPTLVVRVFRTPASRPSLPYAVTVRSLSRDLPGTGWSLDDVVRAVPGLQVDDRHNDALGDRIVVRGFGARAQFGVRGIQVLVDGVPATMPDGQTTLSHLDPALLERAEVLRGPAASTYGNGAGGVLLLSTAQPPAGPFRQEASVLVGDDGLLRFRGTAGGRPGRMAWLASLSRAWLDGFRPHSGTDRWQWTGRLEAPLAGGHVRLVGHGVAYDADNPGALTAEQLAANPHQAQGYNVAQRTGEAGRHGQVGAWWGRPLGPVRVEALAYGLARALDNPIPPTIIDLERRAGGGRLLVRSQGPADRGDADGDAGAPLSWAVGADAATQADDRRNHENEGGEPGALTLDQAERVTNLAVHGQALIPVLPPASLFLGARYDRVAFSADDRLVTAADPDDSGRRTLDAFSPTAGVRVRVGGGIGLFGNVSTAFETPTTTELVNRPDGSGGFNPALEPQRTVSWEAGARAATGALRLEASAYHARVRDALVPFEVAAAPGRQYYRNAAGAVHRGLELVAELRLSRLEALASWARIDAEFTDYEADGERFDGRRVPGVRPWTVEVRVIGRADAGAALQLDYRATGEMAVNDANDAWADGHHLLGLRASVPVRFGAVQVEAYGGVANALDATYVASVVPNAFGGRFYEPGPGRSFFLGLATRVSLGR